MKKLRVRVKLRVCVVLEKRGNITFIYKLSYKNLPRQMVFSPDFYKSLTVKICLMAKFSPTILLD